MSLIETRSHGYYITIFRSPSLSMAPPRRFGIPMHTGHEDVVYPGPNPGESYIRHRTYILVDVGLEQLERHEYLAWSHRVGLEDSGPIRGFEGLGHSNEDAVNWEPWDKFAPDGEVSDPDGPPANPDPVPTPVPDPEPEEEPMVAEQGDTEENPIEIDSDSDSDSFGFDPDWAP